MWPFKKKRIPVPGESWSLFFETEDPWGPTRTVPVKILDVKEGWVRYAFPNIFTDERMDIKTFIIIYKPVE